MSSTYSERSAFEKPAPKNSTSTGTKSRNSTNVSETLMAPTTPWQKLSALAYAERARARFQIDERSEKFFDTENQLIHALMDFTGSERNALSLTGASRSTWHYRSKPRERVQNPIHQSAGAYGSRISEADRERISEYILAGWADSRPVDRSFAPAWDDEVILVSQRTWWRLAAGLEDQMPRPKVPTTYQARQRRSEKPVLKATGPGKIWS